MTPQVTPGRAMPAHRPADLAHAICTGQVSLHWDSGDLVHRFGWRGTWDPAPALGVVAAALAEHASWVRSGETAGAAAVAEQIAEALGGLGLRPTAAPALVPPRLRGFLVPGVTLTDLRACLNEARVRAWSGSAADGGTLLRVATHVYNDTADVVPTIDAVRRALSRG